MRAGPRSWFRSILVVAAWLVVWEVTVRLAKIPAYTLPAPSIVLQTLWLNAESLAGSWWFTLKITFGALLLACVGGIVMAGLFAVFATIEAAFLPLAVVLQVTPVVAIAPLMLIYIDSTTAALLLCAWIVAFFPILSNTLVGLRSADANLRDLFRLYRASPWQRLRWLLAPSALPYFISGVKVSAGLSLIGAVTAEMVAGTAGRETGLASRILEASFRTETPKMFAALALLVITGLLMFWGSGMLSDRLLVRWRGSDVNNEELRR
jgi:NitT/TauT family transport system permease protein